MDMTQTYLPGDTRQRIQDLMKYKKVTQAELAQKISLSESSLSRYLQGKIKNLGDGYIIRIAKYFNVSTDFLLGETDFPDRINYNIEELGLSVESARLLYTGKLDTGMLNQLMTHPRFPQLLRLLARYQDETMTAAMSISNQNLLFLRSMMIGQAEEHPEDACAAKNVAQLLQDLQTPAVASDEEAVKTVFMKIVRDIKLNRNSTLKENKAATAATLKAFRQNLTKGDESFNLHDLTPEIMVDAIIQLILPCSFSPDDLSDLKNVLLKLFYTAKEPNYD